MIRIEDTQFALADRVESFRFHWRRSHGSRLSYLYNRLVWYWFPRWHLLTDFPQHVDIELTNICNMNCPMCYTILPDFVKLEHGFMEFALFRKIVDECAASGAYSIRLSIRGETLLHPDLVDMIRYAKAVGIREVAFLTNGLLLTEELSEQIIDAGLDWMTVSWDGIGKTYERYRAPAKFDEALRRLARFQELKQSKKTRKPVVNVSTVWSAIKDDPATFYRTFRGLADRVTCNPTLDFGQVGDQDPDYACPFPWQRFVIYWNGQVMQCINDPFEDNPIGNVATTTIRDIWHGHRLDEVREAMREGQGARLKKYKACQRCSYGVKRVPLTVKADKLTIATTLSPNKFNFGGEQRRNLLRQQNEQSHE